jgi:hypothetical protein
VAAHQRYMLHNSLRFGLLYLPRAFALQMLRHHAMRFPVEASEVFGWLASSDVWERRERLTHRLAFDFGWFARRFDLHDQIGRRVLCEY